MSKHTTAKLLTNMELSSFCNQMALILKSGISTIEGLSIMSEDASAESEKQILTSIEETLNQTGNFTEALKSSEVFPSYCVHMVDIGEQAGKLDEVMSSLSTHYEREAQIASAIKNAVTYPFIMIAMMMLVILVLVMKVLPVFHQVFEQLGREMTGFSKAILNVGTMLNRYSLIIGVGFAVFIVLFLFCAYTASGRSMFAKMTGALGLNRSLTRKIASCRFASGMTLTLSSGLNSDQSLELAGTLVEDNDFHKKIIQCEELVKEGTDFSAALSQSGIFSGIYARMVTVGFKTGTMDEVMGKIATQYEEDIDNQINRMIAVLEPTLVAVLSIIVGGILLSVMLPLMGIMSNF